MGSRRASYLMRPSHWLPAEVPSPHRHKRGEGWPANATRLAVGAVVSAAAQTVDPPPLAGTQTEGCQRCGRPGSPPPTKGHHPATPVTSTGKTPTAGHGQSR